MKYFHPGASHALVSKGRKCRKCRNTSQKYALAWFTILLVRDKMGGAEGGTDALCVPGLSRSVM